VKGTSRMPVLTEPTPRVHASFVEAIREYREEGRYSRLEPAMLASRRVIEANGGSLASASDGILRFWVPTAPRLTPCPRRCVYMD